MQIIQFLNTGLLNFTGWELLFYTLVVTHISIISITVYLHRSVAHGSLELHPFAVTFFKLWTWATTSMLAKEWACVHRKHHAKCETAEDPHSPKIYGLAKVLRFGSELYKIQSRNPETLARYGKDLKETKLDQFLINHRNAGIIGLLVLNILLFGMLGVAVWSVQMMWSPFFAAGVINGVGHFSGYRNHNCADQSRNILPWGILIGGEELHNNHHANPTSAKLSFRWYEFDIGWMYIKALTYLKLAKVRQKSRAFHFSPLSLAELKVVVEFRLSKAIKKYKALTNEKSNTSSLDASDIYSSKLLQLITLRDEFLGALKDKSLTLQELEDRVKSLIFKIQAEGVKLKEARIKF